MGGGARRLQTADINRLHALPCDGDGGSYSCAHRPAKRAVATAATAATPTVTPGGGGDFGRRDRRPVKRASAIAVTAAAPRAPSAPDHQADSPDHSRPARPGPQPRGTAFPCSARAPPPISPFEALPGARQRAGGRTRAGRSRQAFDCACWHTDPQAPLILSAKQHWQAPLIPSAEHRPAGPAHGPDRGRDFQT